MDVPDVHDVLKDVGEGSHFYSVNGSVVKNYHDLANHLMMMSDDHFRHHVNESRNDFHNWVKDIHKDHHLADKLAKSNSREEMHHHVRTRIHEINAMKKRDFVREAKAELKYNAGPYLIGIAVGMFIGLLIGML